MPRPLDLFRLHLAGALLLAACQPGESATGEPMSEPMVTNRIALPPEVVANLGVTFAVATRGRVGVVVTVPGELQVPEHRRFTLRAPSAGRLRSVAPRWQTVAQGDVVAELAAPDLAQIQQKLLAATSTLGRAAEEAVAATARLDEGELLVRQAEGLAAATETRLEQLDELASAGNALIARERIDARRAFAEAATDRLQAAILRDELRARAADKQLQREQAKLGVDQQLASLSVLTGRPAAELEKTVDGETAWRTIDALELRAPAAGTVVELFAAAGEPVAAGTPLLLLMDTRELRFVGLVPEGDLGQLHDGAPVRIELPARDLEPIDTELIGPLPVADARLRALRVEAVVPDPERRLAHGLSATAHVRVRESAHEEVLLPRDCVVLDGLLAIVFRRDPADPGIVIRTPVELGQRGGELVEVLAGVLDGDAVVEQGVHQLAQQGAGKTPQGGHFHADGTWHEEHK